VREPQRSNRTSRVDVEVYQRDGFVVLDDLLEPDELEALRHESVSLCRGERGSVDGLEAVAATVPDDEALRRVLCIHFPHKLSPLARQLLVLPRIVDVLTQLIGPDVKAMQSMLFIKAEGKPGQAWHQDEYFIPTRDRSLTAAWIALDDATTENGCLWVLSGSHRQGVLYPEREIDDGRFDCTTEACHFPYDDSEAVPVEVPAGAAVIFNGYLLHRSLPNVAKHGLRRAMANHYMSAQSLLPWRAPRPGEHVAMVDDRDIVLVAGEDPYAYKGLEDHHQAYLRRDRDGGCDR
jgi:ectoine hydroxylase-related dioxygenase (phytanoyl-CoA dioxygenase family)